VELFLFYFNLFRFIGNFHRRRLSECDHCKPIELQLKSSLFCCTSVLQDYIVYGSIRYGLNSIPQNQVAFQRTAISVSDDPWPP